MRVRIEIQGAETAVLSLREVSSRLERPPRPLLEALGQEWKALFRANLHHERLGAFEPLAAVTLEHREEQGYSPGPILVRSGSLATSIDLLGLGETWVEVGPRDALGRSQLLHFGGRTSPRSRHADRPVPPRPFIRLSREDVDLSVESFAEALLEGTS